MAEEVVILRITVASLNIRHLEKLGFSVNSNQIPFKIHIHILNQIGLILTYYVEINFISRF